jgi:hypothetical protein
MKQVVEEKGKLARKEIRKEVVGKLARKEEVRKLLKKEAKELAKSNFFIYILYSECI